MTGHTDDVPLIEPEQKSPTKAINILTLALCLSSGFQQGYIASVLNQPYHEIEIYMNNSWIQTTGVPMSRATIDLLWSLLNVCFPIATIFGQFAAAVLVAKIGRKSTALVASFLYIPATLLSASARWIPGAFELLYVGRILWSFANGIASVNATVWIVECAPAAFRGRMAAMQEVFMGVGSLVTQFLGVWFSTANTWEWMFVPNVIFVLLNVLLFLVVYESPQFLIEKWGDYDTARKALAEYHGVSEHDPLIDNEINVCEEAMRKNDEGVEDEHHHNERHSAFDVMFNPWVANDPASKVIRQNAWVGLMVKVAYVFTGARCLRAFSSYTLHELGGYSMKSANIGSFINSIFRLPVTLLPVFLVDSLGRRPLILVSTAISLISLVAMEAAIAAGDSWRVITMAGLSTLLLINAWGLGSVSRFYCAELVPRSVLLQSVSVLTALEAGSKIGVEFIWYPIANYIGGESLLLFTVPTAIFLYFMYRYCPETSKKNVKQVLNETAKQRNLDVSF